jgi:hypothetical protein
MKMIIVPTPISARLSFFHDVLIFMFLSPLLQASGFPADTACRLE